MHRRLRAATAALCFVALGLPLAAARAATDIADPCAGVLCAGVADEAVDVVDVTPISTSRTPASIGIALVLAAAVLAAITRKALR